MAQTEYGEISIERMFGAVQKVRERLLKATAALEEAGVPYAVAGGHVVAAWVSRVDEAAVRNTQDVDILLRREDLDAATEALTGAGFVRRETLGVEMFVDGPGAKSRDAVHVVFANEKVRASYAAAAPDVDESERNEPFRVVGLEALVRMKLTSFLIEDRMYLRDMLDVGLIDDTWPARFPSELAERLQELIDNPEE